MPGIFSFDMLKRKLASKQRSFREGCHMGGRSDGSVGRSFGRGRGDAATDPEEWGTDLGFTRDRQSMLPKSATADLGAFPQENVTN
jgi:hypothetical protein